MAAATDLAQRLRLDPHPDGGYVSGPQDGDRRIFGGLLMGLALRAAAFTVPSGREAHSVHGRFLESGDGRLLIRFHVEQTWDGASFSCRRVIARQGQKSLFVATASFQSPEPGLAYEPPATGAVPPPEGLPAGRYETPRFDSRDLPVDSGEPGPRHVRRAWFRARRPLPDDPALHAQALVYLSDHGPTRAVRQPHAGHPRMKDRMSVSLDHAVWLHGPVRVDQWLLSELHPAATGAGRGLALGSIRAADGRLVATIAQEALLRMPDS